MGFLNYLEYIRKNKSDTQKNIISFNLAIILTIIIFIFWFFTNFSNSVKEISDVSQENSPFPAMINTVKNAF
ncbi:MAG TPA: hypothetical protein PJ997_00650 [Candidatus Paceibacterota bacterium]|nr:hypothetical protein [Candidatus Paceibacterota bacterium]HMP18835.1 hypothetical protein [Candidatus Paceibacterota bacterium]HMP85373.1 hypothetical protein [Candidatus Paceibacterota bacterium]